MVDACESAKRHTGSQTTKYISDQNKKREKGINVFSPINKVKQTSSSLTEYKASFDNTHKRP